MPIIPAPLRVTPRAGTLRLGPDLTVGAVDPALAAVTGRFCADLRRRTGIRARTAPEGTGQLTVVLGDVAGRTAPLGLHPGGAPRDEGYALTVGPDGVAVRAPEPAGAARALTSLLQLAAATPPDSGGLVTLAARDVLDAPRFAWRGLSLDVARRFFSPARLRQVIDLLALYKLNVLHLHLTDDEAWRIEPGRPAAAREPDGTFYTAAELADLLGYAAERFVTIVAEVDSPGHAAALLGLRPELRSGRNQVSYLRVGGERHDSAWLDPELPGTIPAVAEVFAGLAEVLPGPFVHVGGDETWRMPEDAYRNYARRLLEVVRSLGLRPVGWQELVRADAGPLEAIQFWMSPASFEAPGEAVIPPETAAMVAANAARTRSDLEQARRRQVPVIMSPSAHCYLDVPYAEDSADPAQAERRGRVGLRNYRPLTLAESFGWDPVTALGAGAQPRDVAGVEAAMWGETLRDFDDLTFALLPRLPGVAEKAWGAAPTTWPDHRQALARHARLWTQDALTFFRASPVPWSPGPGS